MSPDAAPGGRFATTRWSLVLAAGQGDSDLAAPALSSLCEIYWSPVYAFTPHRAHAERLFDYRWGLVLFERVLSRLREEHRAAGRGDQFDHLKGFLTSDAEGVPCKEAADRIGMSEGALKVAVHRLRRRYRDTLMEEIAETVSWVDCTASGEPWARRPLVFPQTIRTVCRLTERIALSGQRLPFEPR